MNALPYALSTPYTAYVADVSYFSGKMEAYLRYKQIPFNRIEATVGKMLNVVYENTGLMKVPAIKTPDGQWLRDTTPMIDWFEAHHPQYPISSGHDATDFLSKLVEDYADEWCWRSAIYWRWHYPDTRRLLGARISEEVLGDWPVPKNLSAWYFAKRQSRLFLQQDGVTSSNEGHVRQHYLKLLASLGQLLSDQAWLLGGRPSLVDFAFFGPMFRHFSLDPAPAKIMRDDYPAVYEWVARLWNARGEKFAQGALNHADLNDFSHPGWAFILSDTLQAYWPYLLANAKAWQAGLQYFDYQQPDYEQQGGIITYPHLQVNHYRVLCLEWLQKAFFSLSATAQTQVRQCLQPYGELAWIEGLDSGLSAEYQLPLKPRQNKVGLLEKLRLMATGTPGDLPRSFQG